LRSNIRNLITLNKLITILGPTATGKTSIATALASAIDAEVISADSRQVYKGMDLGTGKDLQEYTLDGKNIPYHLIDIANPGEEYNVFSFQKDLLRAYNNIIDRDKKAIMCGGTGMYLESVILAYDMLEVPVNEALREELNKLSTEELMNLLTSLREIHNITDISDRSRLIRAIEIAEGRRQKTEVRSEFPALDHKVFGISLPREVIRSRITARLKQRLEEGMLDEIQNLLDSGVSPEQLEFYGLEYKYLTQRAIGEISYNDMFQRLNSAIHQFAKRQMTWFRRMEKKGVKINWIDGNLPIEEKVQFIIDHFLS
jgi:tRNA dimethylallyltransferase